MTIVKKHILVLASWYPNKYNASNGNFNQAYVRYLAQLYKISVLHIEHRKEVEAMVMEESNEDNAFILRIYVPTNKGKFGKLLNHFAFHKACKIGVKHIERKHGQINLLHNFVIWKMGVFTRWLSKKTQIPYLVTVHSTSLYPGPQSYDTMKRYWIKKVLEDASKVTSVSSLLLNALESYTTVKNKSVVIPNIVEPPVEDISANVKKRSFVHVSSLEPKQKNTLGIIKAIQGCPEAQLDVIGGNGSIHLKDLKDYVRTHNLDNRVTFLGDMQQQELVGKLSEYLAMIHFSNYESFSIVCAEAMSVGTPVIYTACGGPEEFLDSSTGLEVNKQDVIGLTNAITKILNEDISFDRNSIKQKFKEKFNNQKSLEAFSKLYEELT